LTLFVLAVPAPPLDNEADSSLTCVLAYAHKLGLQFGKDIVCTYGPLGFLVFPYFSAGATAARLLVALGLSYLSALGVTLITRRQPLAWRWCMPAVYLWVGANMDHPFDFVTEIALLSWGWLSLTESGKRQGWFVATFVLLSAFVALAKTSFLFAGFLAVTLVCGGLLSRGLWRVAVVAIVGLSVSFVLGWLLAGQNILNVASWLKMGLAVVRGYQDAQGWEELRMVKMFGPTLAILVALLIALRVSKGECPAQAPPSSKLSNYGWRFFSGAFVATILLIVWKHGFVRGDTGHSVYFFAFVPMLALALEILPLPKRGLQWLARSMAVACCVVAPGVLQVVYFRPGTGSVSQCFRTLAANSRTLLAPARYASEMQQALDNNIRAADLPVCRQIIGRSTVDVFGDSQAHAIFNHLNYQPRPVFQTYCACNAALMRLNEDYFLSPRAPEFVLFELGAVDRKFPVLEDAMLLRCLLCNNTMITNEGRFLLLKAVSRAPAKLELLREGVVRAGERIFLAHGNEAVSAAASMPSPTSNIWLEIQLEPSFSGRLRRFFYRPPTVRLAAWSESGSSPMLKRRAPASMLAAGFLASPLLADTDDVSSVYSDAGRKTPASYSVQLLPGEEHFWKSEIKFRIYRIENPIPPAKMR